MRNIIYLLFLIPTVFYGQNVGIGTANPTQKLEVNGKIKITSPAQNVQGGILFPDGSFQSTAYNPVPVDNGGGVLFPDGTFQNTAYVVNNPAPPSGLTGYIAMMIDGPFPGPVNYFQVQAGFNILAYSNGLSSSSTFGGGGGGGGGQVNFQDASITRFVDQYSASIQDYLARGNLINEIKIFSFFDCGDLNGPCYSTIETFDDCYFTSYAIGGGGGELFSENVSFTYRKRTIRAYGNSAAGGSGSAPGSNNPYIETCWDVAMNGPC